MNERYSRQMLFREIGREGQERLLASRVLVVGCGAAGLPLLETLLKASPAGEVSKTEWLIIRRRNLRAAGTRSRALREAAPRMEAEIAELVESGNRFLAEQA